jgi:hypothetical protein
MDDPNTFKPTEDSGVVYLFDTDKYYVEIGDVEVRVEQTGEIKVRQMYCVVNKQTMLREAETSVLPQAMQYAAQFTDALKQLQRADTIVVPPPPKILRPSK